MRKIKFKPEYLKLLREGRKRSTIRLERKYKVGEIVYIADMNGRVYGKAKITKIVEKSLGKLNESDAVIDGFEDLKGLKRALANIYGDIASNKKVYIYYLEVIGWWREI